VTTLHPAFEVGSEDYDDLNLEVAVGTFVPIKGTLSTAKLACDVVPWGGTLIDLGCGVGSVGIWVSVRRPDIHLIGIDRNPLALECARRNAYDRYQLTNASFIQHDGLSPAMKADVVVNTLPYEGAQFWEGTDYDDGQPKDSYIADDSFALSLVMAHQVAPVMVVWALRTMAPVFTMTGWGIQQSYDAPDNSTTFCLQERFGG
jgi:release factor glutamine methyltransferase